MTLVEDAPETQAIERVELPAPPRAPARRPVPVAVALTCMLAALVVCWALLLLPQGRLGNAWFQTRQRHLASDLAIGRLKTFPGQALGILQIPRVGLNELVQEGDDVLRLRSGPGHHAGTPRPGQIGNSVIVGHRGSWGAPFAKLADLHAGDLIVFQGRDLSHNWVYRVTSVKPNVSADDAKPFAESNDHRLTLITDSGGRFSDRRLVVTAVSGAPAGRKLEFGPPASPKIPGASLVANQGVVLLIAGALLAGAVLLAARRRYGRVATALVTTPFLVLALIGLMLEIDLMLPALH